MTPKQTGLVKAGYGTILNMREKFSTAFFKRLFQQDPEFRALFKDDPRGRTIWLVASLGTLAGNLDSAGSVERAGMMPEAGDIAGTMLEYSYFTIGATLLQVLEDSLGKLFTPAMEEAWAMAYYRHGADMFAPYEDMREAARAGSRHA